MAGSDQGRVFEGAVSPLWSVDMPGGGLLLDRSGGCLVATRAGLASFARDGRLRWHTAALGDAPELPVLAPDGAVVRVEGDAVVTRDAATGQVVRSFAALRAARLAVAPWDGLVHSEYAPAVARRRPGASGSSSARRITYETPKSTRWLGLYASKRVSGFDISDAVRDV